METEIETLQRENAELKEKLAAVQEVLRKAYYALSLNHGAWAIVSAPEDDHSHAQLDFKSELDSISEALAFPGQAAIAAG